MPGDAAANAALIDRFYTAFAAGDGATMAASYAPGAHFSDPVFVNLNGPEVGAMWRMLTGRATDLEVVHSDVVTDPDSGSAHWDADYTFSTGRKVHNPIDANFKFENGLIVDHRDSFDLYAWSRQALGPLGLLFGWTPVIHNKIRTQARQGLEEFMSADSAPAPS